MNSMENDSLGVRKGAWTKAEDLLLKQYIEKYGEGKWHDVPQRAGVNRCRKSCRARWLNYLRPDVNRSCFTKDETDLIIRLHRLLGNKWSLIAGRVPGRTANDVKNFWKTHIEKTLKAPSASASASGTRTPTFSYAHGPKTITEIIKPEPRTFSRVIIKPVENIHQVDDNKLKPPEAECSSLPEIDDECTRWWSKLLEIATENNSNGEAVTAFLKDQPMN